MEPARWWDQWYRERMVPLMRLYVDIGGPDDFYGDYDLADEYDFDFDEGEY